MKKRIALAAIAALAGGLLVAAPASANQSCHSTKTCVTVTNPALISSTPWAIVTPAGTWGTDSTTASVTQEPSAGGYVTIRAWANETSTASGSWVAVSGSTIKSADQWTVNSAKTLAEVTDNNISGDTITVSTEAAGTITVTTGYYKDNSGVITRVTEQTFTITVKVPAVVAYNHSEVSKWTMHAAGTYIDAAGALYGPKAETLTGYVDVKQYTSSDTATPAGAKAKDGSATLTGVGLISVDNGATWGTYLVFSSDSTRVWVKSDGRSGTSSISINVNGSVVATRNVTFYGAVTSYTVSLNHNQVQAGHTDELILTVTSKDANGVAVPTDAKPNIKSDSATVSARNTTKVAGTDTYTVNAASKVAASIQVANGVDTKTVVANFVTAGVETITVTADKATYAPGEQATFTISAVNVDGVVVGDDDYAVKASASASVIGLVSPQDLEFVDGKATFKGYMPLAQGPVKVMAEVGNGDASVSVTVVDAAAVANAALIADLKTQVLTLTTTVGSLSASLIPQIKVINATMLKIQKAIAALRLQIKKLK